VPSNVRSRFSAFSGAFLLCVSCDPPRATLLSDAEVSDAEVADADAAQSDPEQPTLPARTEPTLCMNRPPEFVARDLSNWSDEILESLIECDSNDDCREQANGYCTWNVFSQVPATHCTYGCETDQDCHDDEVCDCGPDVGTCVPAACTGPADCGGNPCVRFDDPGVCIDGQFGPGVYYDCMSSDDECSLPSDCSADQTCSAYDDAELTSERRCQTRRLCGI
jgi:hypothetical protein